MLLIITKIFSYLSNIKELEITKIKKKKKLIHAIIDQLLKIFRLTGSPGMLKPKRSIVWNHVCL